MKTDEYAPVATPTNIANAKSFSVSPPKSNNDRIGRSTTSDVLTERMNTWFSDSSHVSAYPSLDTIADVSVFSLILS